MRSALIFLLFVVCACSSQKSTDSNTQKMQANYCQYSKYLSIHDSLGGFAVRIEHPDSKSNVYHLFIPKPVKHLTVLSATHIGMLSALHQERCIAGISDLRFVYSPLVRKRTRNKLVEQLDQAQNEQTISIEKLMKSKSEYVVYSAFSGSFSNENRLKKLGIQCIPDYDWREESALGKAEWVLLFGALTGKMKEAQELFTSIQSSFQKEKSKLASIQQKGQMISGNVTGDYWYAPAGESFMAQLYRIAGFQYVYEREKGTGSLAYSMEKIILDGKQVTIWMNPGFSTKKAILAANPKAKHLPFFSKARIYCYTHNSNKYWELGALRPDWILSDFHALLTNDKGKKPYFYQEVR